MIETASQREKREKAEAAERFARQERYIAKHGGKPALSDLAQCEAVIAKGLDSFIDVGNALVRIRDERLYKEKYSTFEDYCEERWQMSSRHANRLIGSSKVASNLGPMGLIPASERVARPLAKLEPSVQREVYSEAVKSSRNGKPSAKEVETAVAAVTPQRAERISYRPSNGLQYAAMAISNLEKIQPNDTERVVAFAKISAWLTRNK